MRSSFGAGDTVASASVSSHTCACVCVRYHGSPPPPPFPPRRRPTASPRTGPLGHLLILARGSPRSPQRRGPGVSYSRRAELGLPQPALERGALFPSANTGRARPGVASACHALGRLRGRGGRLGEELSGAARYPTPRRPIFPLPSLLSLSLSTPTPLHASSLLRSPMRGGPLDQLFAFRRLRRRRRCAYVRARFSRQDAVGRACRRLSVVAPSLSLRSCILGEKKKKDKQREREILRVGRRRKVRARGGCRQLLWPFFSPPLIFFFGTEDIKRASLPLAEYTRGLVA